MGTMSRNHPTDLALADALDGCLDEVPQKEIERHVESCGLCRFRISQSYPAADADLRSYPALPEVVVDVHEMRDEAPVAGDIWRLSWDAVVVLAVIWDVGQDRLRVLPVLDTCDADEWCALLAASASGGLGDIAVSVALEIAVPGSVLDARVSRLPDMAQIARLRTEYRSGQPAGPVPRGEMIRSPRDERLVTLDELGEDLACLANAGWMPDTTGHAPPADRRDKTSNTSSQTSQAKASEQATISA